MSKLSNFVGRLPMRVYRRIFYSIMPGVITWKVKRDTRRVVSTKPHGLPKPLVVSLTSYPARFPTLPLTLKCLLTQSVTPDRLILWLAHDDKNALTQEILDFQSRGLEIQFCDNLRSYKKIIPTLQCTFDVFVVTADDDQYYWPTWLEELVNAYQGNNREVLSHRMHRIRLDRKGFPIPYNDWEAESLCNDTSPLNFPTGCGGVFYPPGVFLSEVVKVDIFKALCPYADDVWLYWMARLNGSMARKVGGHRYLITWANSQASALYHKNVHENGNDTQIEAMICAYGFPSPKSSAGSFMPGLDTSYQSIGVIDGG